MAGGSLEKAIAATPLTGLSPLTDLHAGDLLPIPAAIDKATLHPTAAFSFARRALHFSMKPLLVSGYTPVFDREGVYPVPL